jgi:hypothetical protein
MKRPLSVTVVAWVIIVVNAIIAVLMLIGTANADVRRLSYAALVGPIPPEIQLAFGYCGVLVSLICGIFMLRGSNWARITYISWCIVGALLALTNKTPMARVLVSAVAFIVAVFFLTREPAKAFFAGGRRQSGRRRLAS